MSEDGVLVRRDWMFEVRSACQRFQCLTLNADRTQLEERLRRLAQEVPAPGTIQEAEALTDRLKICSTDAGMALHLAYHEASAYQTCTASPVELAMHVWRQYHADPRVTYLLWIDTFFAAFDSTHPAPSCERAAAILRHRYANVPSLRAVAKEVGASTSQLNRDFRRRYKMSCGEYSSRARLRWFIGEIRKPDSTATRLAMEAGYRS